MPNDPTPTTPPPDDILSDVIAAYLQAVDAGQTPDHDELLRDHPEIADDLRRFFADQEQINQFAQPLRAAAEGTTNPVTITAGPPAGGDRVAYFGDYELRGEIARGGMGVVYRARQVSLDRPVALKMILAGAFASSDEVRRFHQEAAAAANLDHPHIVPIYEVGEDQGQHFYSMKLIEGSGLNRYLPRFVEDPRAAVRLLVTVAYAVHHAHQRGILHRDLKPGNILVEWRDGGVPVPHVTDFGLARRIESDSSLTRTGAIVGTPEYMAPEQARSEKTLTTGVDVYSLGAILYALLTGKPPFHGDNILETLRLVENQEPVPPRSLNARVPRDVEIICLKCLHKDAARRYGSAEALANDLERFLGGEPILARPVGRLERAVLWVKRNPVPTAALAAIVGVMLVGTIVSTLFGIDAHIKEVAAETARNDLAQKNSALEQSQDKLEGALAQTWLGPLAETPGPLNDAEVAAFAEVAANRNGQLSQRYITEILRDRRGIRRLRARAEFVLHAAIGLDRQKRQEVERQLVRALEAVDVAEELRIDLARAAAELGELSPAAAAMVAQTLCQGLVKTNDSPDALLDLVQCLSAVSNRLEPNEAARVSAEAAAALTLAMTKTNNPDWLLNLAKGLLGVSARLEPNEAARVSAEAAAALTQAMPKTNAETLFQGNLAAVLSAVLGRMDAKDAAATLTLAMTKTNDLDVLLNLAQDLSAVSNRLEPQEAARVATRAVATILTLPKTIPVRHPSGTQKLAKCLSTVLAPLDANEAARVSAEAAATLTLAMTKTNDYLALWRLTQALSAVSTCLEVKGAGKAAATLTLAMTQTNNPNTLMNLAQGLSAVSTRLEAKDAARVATQAAVILTLVLTKTSDPDALFYLDEGLLAVAGKVEAKEAANVSATLTLTMTKRTHPHYLKSLAQALSGVSTRLEAKEAARVCAEAAAILTLALTKTNNPNEFDALAQGLSAVSVPLEAKEAARVSAQAADILTLALTKTNDPIDFYTLGHGLSALSARLESKEAARMSAALTLAITKTIDSNALYSLADGLSKVLARLEAKEAKAVATMLTQAMAKTGNNAAIAHLAQGLSAVSGRLEAKEAAATLMQALTKTNDPNARLYLAQGLAAVSMRLEAKEAARVSTETAAKLTLAMTKPNDANALRNLAQGLSVVSGRVEAKEAADAVATLLRLLAKSHYSSPPTFDDNGKLNKHIWVDTTAHYQLAKSLLAMSVRLEPKEAARVAAQAVAILTQTMAKTDGAGVEYLRHGLSEVLGNDQRDQSALAVATTIGCLPESKGFPGAVLLLHSTMEPFPRRLSDQDLVELLKDPLCVGEARWGVLDQLGLQHRRAFANQWEFVRFAEEQNLGLDFISPPKRP